MQPLLIFAHVCNIGGSRVWGGGVGSGVASPPPFEISKIKESNKTKEKIEDNPLKWKNRERVACLSIFYVYMHCYV